ncbi:MAG: tetraacyldisaccharide 4'-kinase [Sulfurimonas sp.]|uniref:tetraacyldisaccharide 4'-kinase n=1 Tax=Sulfurimonas sp. TaxID=2022749 RepID=UPI0025F37F29|nr:tetraacyldisaccharide 4'-kinase [Sulfurimonas sp.]MCK9491363.1 tetraacyldisaccharide 4'-kinase [Sulfurimonas sp.]
MPKGKTNSQNKSLRELKKRLVFWVERYFYKPTLFDNLLSFLLLPLSWIYCFAMFVRFKSKEVKDFNIDIVSVGNLSVGGSGKTPLVTALASRYENSAVILRGYGRKSRGLFVVKEDDKILCDVNISGDEAMIYAKNLSSAIVIVSEDRNIAIQKARDLGAKIIFLDDAYSKHDIKKLDFLIEVDAKNKRCLPSGAFRERLWASKDAITLKENRDFKRVVHLRDKSDKMSLVTAIARPSRLDEYLPANVVQKHYFEDHHSYTKSELEDILKNDGSETLLVTYKDFVKIEAFNLPISLLDLEVEVDDAVFDFIDNYRMRD